jgi:processive 1,2-diacylglycerol beta-glucosyltransferase
MREPRTDLVVVHCPVGGGHKAAALAITEAARARGLSVEVVDAFAHAPRWAGDAYLAAHLTGQNAVPDFYGEMYFAANHRGGLLDPLRVGFDGVVFGGLAAHVASLSPRAIVATHHLPLVVLGRERTRARLAAPLAGVITDYMAHACWVEPGVDAFAVPAEAAATELVEHGADPRAITVTGIPVRAAFEHVPPILPRGDRRLRVLVTSGGFGVGPIARIVASFAGIDGIDLTVVCGSSEKVAAKVGEAGARAGVATRVIGFERDMPARIAEADVVVGKAGGLTVTETMTAGRPMVIASAVPGNEAINERFVVEAGAGVSAAPEEVGRAVAELRARGALRSMAARARELVPRGAAAHVVDVAIALARRAHLAA